MINRIPFKQSFLNKNNNTNIFSKNPYRVKRTYNAILEQDHSMPNIVNFIPKRIKQNDTKAPESLIKYNKSKIPEKILKEIERYNYQRYQYNIKVNPCTCED